MVVCSGILVSGLAAKQYSTLYCRARWEFLGFQILCSILENSVLGSSSRNILRKGEKIEDIRAWGKKVNHLLNKDAFMLKRCQCSTVGDGI